MSHDHRSVLTRCKGLTVTMWSDALDECKIKGVISGLTQRSGGHQFVGFAVTARQQVGEHGNCTAAELGVTEMLEATRKDDVLVVDMGGVPVSTFGGLAAATAVANGAAAVIIDGACRDLGEVQATGLWVATRHVVPTSGKKRAKLIAMGEAVTIGGMTVNAGDLLVGDETGVVVVPQADILRVSEIAMKNLAQDQMMERALKAGRTFAEAAAEAKYF